VTAANKLASLKTLYETTANIVAGAGVAEWLSRQPRDQKKGCQIKGEVAGGLRARRGSNPFPGAINILLDKHPASQYLGFLKILFAIFPVVKVPSEGCCGSYYH
jgi:hypothetical protein